MGISGEFYYLLENYLSGRFQRIALNGHTSSWKPILAGAPQRSIIGPLLFLIYINDLPNKLKSNVKSLPMTHLFILLLRIRMKVLIFSTMTFRQSLHEPITPKLFLNQVLVNSLKRCHFKKKKKIKVDPIISLNNVQVERVSYQKHLGILLDEKLNFKQHIVLSQK